MQGNTCISIKQKAEGKNEKNEENMGTHARSFGDALPAARCSNGGRGGILLAQQKHGGKHQNLLPAQCPQDMRGRLHTRDIQHSGRRG